METRAIPVRRDRRIIIHFDYDCFYASVFEAENPSLKSVPFAVQQKQIIVTCNYAARRRGLHKLQLIKEAKRICPEVVIELGEDISRFRDASKELYQFVKSFSWNDKIERLGFDEVWLDITDVVDYNMEILNRNDLPNSFFQTDKDDPTKGFMFDATTIAGHTYPKDYVYVGNHNTPDDLTMRLRLGGHAALHIRHQLEQLKGYTSTVGIATSKLLSKLVGSLNKPKGQTTVMPPLEYSEQHPSSVTKFMDPYEIGKLPGIGFKLAQKLREYVLQRPATFDAGLVYGGTKEMVTVADLRTHPDVNPKVLEEMLSGPGSPQGIGYKIWCLLHGVDDTEVSAVKTFPSQISIEDSYIRLDTMSEVLKQFTILSRSLLTRMQIDLLGDDDDFEDDILDAIEPRGHSHKPVAVTGKKWLAHAKTLRLTTRPRQPLQPDGTRVRSFKRISHSAPLPSFVFNLNEHIDALADKLVKEALIPMFRKLHPEKAGWNLSLVNVGVTNMAETAGASKTANGRDISSMFRKQEDVLKDFRVTDTSTCTLPTYEPVIRPSQNEERFLGVQAARPSAQADTDSAAQIISRPAKSVMLDEEGDDETAWDDGEEYDDMDACCPECGIRMPAFAMIAHQRFHQEAMP